MEVLAGRAEAIMREVIAGVPERAEATERLDDGSAICVSIRRHGDELTIDFAGTAGQHPGNLNAPPSVTHSAVLYVLRLLAGRDMPLNEAMLRPVKIVIPRGMLNPSFIAAGRNEWPAVAGGNVETSQRVVDTLLKALGIVACSQGTMNNVLFGNDQFGYYETICGGTGGGPGFDGASAVHSHMTNTRITDVEVMERRYPVRVRRFALRANSGGYGKYRGGDGVIRELEFREPVTLSILSQHRIERPYGAKGGGDGEAGRQYVVRADGSREVLRGIDGAHLNAGDRFIVETPGGGGWGTQ
jgi:5-oxoprolinase (ATP-hydrolysing)